MILLCAILPLAVFALPFDASAQDEPTHPLSLRDCIDLSLASSPDALAAQERIEQARAAVKQAQAGFYPRLSINETFLRSNFAPMVFSNELAQAQLSGSFPFPPPPGFDPFGGFNNPPPLSNWNTQLLLQWPLFQGGRTFYGNRAAVRSLSASELGLKTVHNDLTFAVTSAYYEILKTENSIKIAEESVRQIRSQLDVASARFENEVALKSDVLRVTVRLAESEEALAIARHNIERAKSQLNLAMGQPVTRPLELAGTTSEALGGFVDKPSLEESLELARRNRPELEGMNKNIEALENSAGAAKAGYYPQINAFAHYDIDSEDFSDSNDSWTIGIGASLSIFDGFLTRSAVQSTRAKLREAEAQRDKLLLQIESEVKNAILAKSEAATRLDALAQSVAEAEETFRIVSDRYSEGLALVTELLDAEVALTNVRLHRLSAEYNYMVASAAIERATGGAISEGFKQ
ncbi:TolC family protein [Candidatus Poribacteria bacterium]|nr:TolC family protein [Candidatus Poribacteria bacterium]